MIIADTHAKASGSSTRPFFVLAFALTWGVQLPAVAARAGLLPGGAGAYLPLAMLGVLGPLLAALWLTARAGGPAAVGQLCAGLLRWRASPSQYALALLVPGALLSGGLWLAQSVGYAGPLAFPPDPERWLAAVVIALAEELAWRGYALPRLQARHGAFAASGLLGMLWTLWHIPMFLGLGVSLALLPWMLLYFIGGSLLFTFLYQRSSGSLALVVLAHLAAHANNSHAALPEQVVPLILHSLIYAALGLSLALLDRDTFSDLRPAQPEPRTPLRDSHVGLRRVR